MSALVYGARVRAELERQGLHRRVLAERSGLSLAYVHRILQGRVFPRLDVSLRIAEALAAPACHDYVLELRSKTCPVCDRPFVADHHNYWKPTTYCTPRCNRVANLRRRRDQDRGRTARRAAINAYQLELYQQAVDAHCRGCEPQGLCRTAACPLRGVSPLPLARERVA